MSDIAEPASHLISPMIDDDTVLGHTPENAAPPVHSWDPVKYYDWVFRHSKSDIFYKGSGYGNFGYWGPDTLDAVAACDQLVDKLVDLLPKGRANVLDVACGCGGTTNRLAKHFAPSTITAINISKYQVERTRERAPDARVLEMSATELSFPSASFDNVICVEAAFGFRTRLRFFSEAYRVLVPGGGLSLTDILFEPPAGSMRVGASALQHQECPLVNMINAATYRDMLEVIGFKNVTIRSVMDETWKSFMHYAVACTTRALCRLGEADCNATLMRELVRTADVMRAYDEGIKDYILVSATK